MADSELTDSALREWTIFFEEAHHAAATVNACYFATHDTDTASFLIFRDHNHAPVYVVNAASVLAARPSELTAKPQP